jgi:hypothetical protein
MIARLVELLTKGIPAHDGSDPIMDDSLHTYDGLYHRLYPPVVR